MVNIEEFRASLAAKCDLAFRLADAANEAGSTRSHAYLRGRGGAFKEALEMLADVEFGDEALADSWDEGYDHAVWTNTGVRGTKSPGNPYRVDP